MMDPIEVKMDLDGGESIRVCRIGGYAFVELSEPCLIRAFGRHSVQVDADSLAAALRWAGWTVVAPRGY